MSIVKETSSIVFETTDGKTFLNKKDAEKHQEYLNKPKVYIIHNSRDRSVEEVFEIKESANKRKDELNSGSNRGDYYVDEYILVKG